MIISYYYPGHINLFKYDSGLVDCPCDTGRSYQVIPNMHQRPPCAGLQTWVNASDELGRATNMTKNLCQIKYENQFYVSMRLAVMTTDGKS